MPQEPGARNKPRAAGMQPQACYSRISVLLNLLYTTTEKIGTRQEENHKYIAFLAPFNFIGQ